MIKTKTAAYQKGRQLARALSSLIFSKIYKLRKSKVTIYKRDLELLKDRTIEISNEEIMNAFNKLGSIEDVNEFNDLTAKVVIAKNNNLAGSYDPNIKQISIYFDKNYALQAFEQLEYKGIDFNSFLKREYRRLNETIFHEVEHYIQDKNRERSIVNFGGKPVNEFPEEKTKSIDHYEDIFKPLESDPIKTTGYSYLKSQFEVGAHATEAMNYTKVAIRDYIKKELKTFSLNYRGPSFEEDFKKFLNEGDKLRNMARKHLGQKISQIFADNIQAIIDELWVYKKSQDLSIPSLDEPVELHKYLQGYVIERIKDLFAIYCLYINQRWNIIPADLTEYRINNFNIEIANFIKRKRRARDEKSK